MKKALTIILMLTIVMIITACGRQNGEQSSAESESNTAEAAATIENETETSAESNESDELTINIEALNKIESMDTFDVKISGAEFVQEYFLNPDTPPMARTYVGDDALKVIMENNTSQVISGVDIYIIGYSADGTAKVLPVGMQSGSLSEKDFYIQKIGVSTEIQPGENIEQFFETYIGDVQEVNCIVASYTVDGKEVKNPSADEWYNSVFN